jgi:hypothetical protein
MKLVHCSWHFLIMSSLFHSTAAAKDGAACISKLRDLIGVELRKAVADVSGQQKVSLPHVASAFYFPLVTALVAAR